MGMKAWMTRNVLVIILILSKSNDARMKTCFEIVVGLGVESGSGGGGVN